jgi:hypothetical protein
MSTAFPPRPVHADWKTLYQAAILEPDKSVMRQKVCQAEAAILERARELFYGCGTSEEKESLEDALYLLRAYRDASEHADDVTGSAAKSAA